jgi:hypothetical protein
MSAVVLLLLLQGPPPRPAPPRPGLSWQDADSFAQKIQAFEKHPRVPAPKESTFVTEGELNSYLNLTLAGKMPAGLRDLDLKLDKDRLQAQGQVDFDQIRQKMPQRSRFDPISLLGGRVGFELQGKLVTTQDGFGSMEVESARLGPVSLPVSFLAQCVLSLSKTPENPQGFDIQSPFRLPYSLRRVRVVPGRIVLDF